MRIVNKGIVPLLTTCLDRKSRPLLLVVLTFLVKLSAYKENIEDIAQTSALDKICQIIPSEETDIAGMVRKLAASQTRQNAMTLSILAILILEVLLILFDTNDGIKSRFKRV